MFQVLKLSKKSKEIGNMVDLLRQGATLTELACPACASPLFRFQSGQLWCARCQKRVVVLQEGESTNEVASQPQLDALENTLLIKVQVIEERIKKEENVEELRKLNEVLSFLLKNLEKLGKLKRV